MEISKKLILFIHQQHPKLEQHFIQKTLENMSFQINEMTYFMKDSDKYNLLVEKYNLLTLLGINQISLDLSVCNSKKKIIENFELMHGEEVVITVDYVKEAITIHDRKKLPFVLQREITILDVTRWLDARVSTLHRTYMNKLYLLRKIGRDQRKLIADSSAISITDNFWIRRPDTRQSWKEIQDVRDMNKELMEVVLDGKISEELISKKFDDMTSLFTTRGAFPKMIYAGRLFKKDFNAEYEVAGYEIGNALGISTAEAVDIGNGIVSCKLFTDINTSMCHAADLLYYTDYDNNGQVCKSIYDFFSKNNAVTLINGLQRLYILAYITANYDMLENSENFGLLYSPKTFKFITVAPAYDFNNAFYETKRATDFDSWIVENLPVFLKNNADIVNRIPNAIEIVKKTKYLVERKKACTVDRMNYLLDIQ